MNLLSPPDPGHALRIASLSTQIVDLPFRRLQRFARFEARSQSSLIVRIRSAEGIEGIGECVVPCGPWWSGDTVETMKLMIDTYLAPGIVGQPFRGIAPAMSELDRIARGNAFAKAGVEMALVDLLGKLRGCSAADLLGGRFREACPVAWPLASGDPGQDEAEMHEMLETGRAAAFKVKMGSERLDADLGRIRRLMDSLQARAGLRVDPNEAWGETDAMYAMPRLAEIGVELVEQPVPREQMDVMARIAHCAQVPLMIDEGAQSETDALEAVKRHAAHILSLKLMKAGGLHASHRMASIAMAGGMAPYLGTFLETSIGTAAGLHLAASLPRLPFGGEVIGPMLLAEDIVTDPVVYRDGAAHLPKGPGLGISLDEDKVEHFLRR